MIPLVIIYILRIEYKYIGYSNDTYDSIYALTDKKTIDTSSIKSLVIIELIDQSYTIGISSNIQWTDRLWMNSEPKESHYYEGIYCYYDIYIHEKN